MADKVKLQEALKEENIYLFDEHDIEMFGAFVRKGGLSISNVIDTPSIRGPVAREVVTNFRLWLLAGRPIEPVVKPGEF